MVSEKKALDTGTLLDWWNPKVLADFLGEDVDNLSMTWTGGSLVQRGIMPPDPSRSCTHPWSRKYRSNSCRFIWRLILHESLHRLRRERPVCSIPRPRGEFPEDL